MSALRRKNSWARKVTLLDTLYGTAIKSERAEYQCKHNSVLMLVLAANKQALC